MHNNWNASYREREKVFRVRWFCGSLWRGDCVCVVNSVCMAYMRVRVTLCGPSDKCGWNMMAVCVCVCTVLCVCVCVCLCRLVWNVRVCAHALSKLNAIEWIYVRLNKFQFVHSHRFNRMSRTGNYIQSPSDTTSDRPLNRRSFFYFFLPTNGTHARANWQWAHSFLPFRSSPSPSQCHADIF